jgi:hypothetical protein
MTQTQTPPAYGTAPAQPAPLPAAAATLRLGGLSPLFPPASVAGAGASCIADAGTLRMGGLSPVFARG